MAFSDYHLCDHCGDAKTFYDADMDYGHTPDGTLVYGGYAEGPYRVGGFRAYALCARCAETHEIVIVAKAIEAGTAKTEGLGPKDESAVAASHSPDEQHLYPSSAIEAAQIAARNEALEDAAKVIESLPAYGVPDEVATRGCARAIRNLLTPLQQESEG